MYGHVKNMSVSHNSLYGHELLQPVILQTLNMCLRVISSGDAIKSMPKCLTKRGVRGFLPPPGGAQATAIITSSMSFQKSFSRSYKP